MPERKYSLTDREIQLFNALQSHPSEVVDYGFLENKLGISRENLRTICSRIAAKDALLLDTDFGVGVKINDLNGLSINWTKKEFSRTIPD